MTDLLETEGVSWINKSLKEAERVEKAENTRRRWKTGFRKFIRWVRETGREEMASPGKTVDDCIFSLQPIHMEHFAADLEVSDGTARQYVNGVSWLYRYLEKRGEITEEENPVENADFSEILYSSDKTKMEKELRGDDGYVAMSPDEWESFVEHLPSPTIQNELLYRLMWDCGLRTEEVIDVRIRDIDREVREIAVHSDKTNSDRTVFFGESVNTLLNLYLDRGHRERFNTSESSPYLLITNRSEQMSKQRIRSAFRDTCDESGIDTEPVYYDAAGKPRYKLHCHSLRHGFGERMVDRGVDLETLRDTMGHKSVKTTQMYINHDKETRRRKIQTALDGG